MRALIRTLVIVLLFTPFAAEASGPWQQIKDKHFIVLYQEKGDRPVAQAVLRKAEHYYRKIGDLIGYTRFSDFWTWEERVKIILFPDRESFASATGQPVWSLGSANRDSQVFRSRTIMSYPQEGGFIDGLLPHEISHLVMYDFFPDRSTLPVWFEEGVAQLEEADKEAQAQRIMNILMGQGMMIHFDFMMTWDIRRETDPLKAEVFYAQSLMMVRFLITKFGAGSFRRLCREMRDGRSFMDALRKATSNRIGSLKDFEKQWMASFRP